MKTCSYCGKESMDDVVSCPGCGTEFATPESDTLGGLFRRPPRPEAASIVLRTFSSEASAHQAVATLRDARIEAFVAVDDCGGLFPPFNANGPFRLVVSSVHRDAAEHVLADMKGMPEQPTAELPAKVPGKSPELYEPPNSRSSFHPFWIYCFGILTGVLVVTGYHKTRDAYSGTVQRDFNQDGRIDGWDTYVNGRNTKVAYDQNGDEQPDYWTYYEDGVSTRWEEDFNFDGKVDIWGAYDSRGVASQSKVDLDFDGKPDVNHSFQFGQVKESHYVLPVLSNSGLVWKKAFFTNGLLRKELLDRNRDGKFDERYLFDIFGVEISRETLKP